MQYFDVFIKNGLLLTMDSDNSLFEKGSLGITGDSISYVGESIEEMDGMEIIDAKGGIVLPGLINGHTHAAMTLFRGLADDLPLMEWLNQYIFPAESRIDSHFVYIGTLLACAEMIMSGTTTFCDMYLFEGDAARAAKDAGMRCLVGEVLYDFDSPNYGSVENGLGRIPLRSARAEPNTLRICVLPIWLTGRLCSAKERMREFFLWIYREPKP